MTLNDNKITSEQTEVCSDVEQVTGIEPACSAWEADILPLNYTCKVLSDYTGKELENQEEILWLPITFWTDLEHKEPPSVKMTEGGTFTDHNCLI